MANKTAVEMGLMSERDAMRVKNVLQKYDLPIDYNVQNPEDFYETFFLDKKSLDSSVTFILPVGIGGVKITDKCEKSLITSVLHTFGAV